jgi:hypothetical protein
MAGYPDFEDFLHMYFCIGLYERKGAKVTVLDGKLGVETWMGTQRIVFQNFFF